MRLYQCLTLVLSIMSWNAWRPSITLKTPNTACGKLMIKSAWKKDSGSAETTGCPHQVGQVWLTSPHELSVPANGSHPLVNGFIQILPDVVLQVVSVGWKSRNPCFKSKPHITSRNMAVTYRLFSLLEMMYMAAAPTYLAKKPSTVPNLPSRTM